ncbi:MAG TPA: Ig-like domain-containing protein [Chitinophagaceae bacterium]|nr:Ig-like domain-containing protein [Chitinophagaceae bacterium]
MTRFFTQRKKSVKNHQHSSSKSSTKSRLNYLFALLCSLAAFSPATAQQLGIYEFTGTGACPNQNPAVTTQPGNATFSNFSTVNAVCNARANVYEFDDWNRNGTINLNEYHQFSITANAGYGLNLTSLSFSHRVSDNNNTRWILRSSLDNYSSNIASNATDNNQQTATVTLPASFARIAGVTFRLYIIDADDNDTYWTIDNVALNGSVMAVPADPANPSSNSPQCTGTGVTLTANGAAPAGETWYWQTTANGTSTANSGATYLATTSGTYYLRSRNNTTLEWSFGAGSVTVTVLQNVGTPVFASGASSTRCQGAAAVNYTATVTNDTAFIYSLDAASVSGGVTINASTGAVTYPATWSGTTTITATAYGCQGPKTATHTVTTNATIGTPVFALGANSFRCLGAGSTAYTATAANTANITYSLDGASVVGGNSINSATGVVTFSALWVGTSTITATATGCGGPKTATHTVSINAAVSTPNFAAGPSSTRCQGAGTNTYSAAAANSSSITYSLDAASIAGGNTINSSTGQVTWAASWSGTTTVTASAAGCNGPKTNTHTVTVSPPVQAPVFALGANSGRCQGASLVTYSATANYNTGITYSLDAASLAAGNSINSSTGAVAFVASWQGTSVITARAAGCYGPQSSTHTVVTGPTVQTPVFAMGAASTKCQGAGTVSYTATATNTSGITYSLDAASISGGNTINASNGNVTYSAAWSGTTVITASAAGCGGPRTATHTVTIAPGVGTPVFAMGASSSRSQGAGTVNYGATAANATSITYSLDAASIAAGNTINAATGDVTYTAAWSGTTIITVTATGCNGNRTATHTVNTNSNTVIKQLYLTDPSQSLDRVDPVNTNDATTASTTLLSTAGTTSTTFTMAPALCDSLVIKAGTITVRTYVTISSGTMPANPAVTALLRYGSTTIINLTNPTYSGGMLTWTGNLPADVTIQAGQAISLQITTAIAGVTFRIDYDSQTKPSRIDLPVSTFIDILSLDVYTAAYPAGIAVLSGVGGTTKYIRAVVTDPFGAADITGLDIKITPTGNTFAATSVATSGCTRTYQYVWNTPVAGGNYVIAATAKEGYENTVTTTKNTDFTICATCAPVALNDSASGTGGNPIVIDILANDNDPNNNMNLSSLAITVQPKNGSAYISNNTIIYLPNGTYQGNDTLTYQICDLTSPTPLCATAKVFLTIDALIVNICGDATKSHVYYIPYPENDAYDALLASGSVAMPSNNLRTIISIKIPYPGMTIVWDEWEDGYEASALNPTQPTTKVWGDGNPYNGIAPGYPSDIIPSSGNIVLDNTMPSNPRNPASIYFDGKDKITSNGQLAITQVTGEPTRMPVQAIKTNVTSTYDFGQSFTIPLGQNFNSRDFRYTALFIRAAENNTVVSIDKDNNGTLETVTTLQEGQSYLVNGGVMVGATVTSTKPVGVELNAGGVDEFSIRNAPIFPATWYSHTYYTPVPTSDNPLDNPKDSSAVMFYNSLNRSININWYFGTSANGTIAVPAKSAVRFPLAYSTTSAYKFVNPTGESFTAIEMVDSYTPGSGGNDGTTYDWSFNLISEARLTDYTTVAWAPGGLDLANPAGPDVNGNPIWVTPTANTIIYVKYNGNVTGNTGSISPCGLRYDVAYSVNALNYIKIKDPSDNDQGGIAIFTCNGAKIAAVYGEDPQGSTTGYGIAYWDVGSTLQPFCKEKLVVASDDFASTLVSQPVTITILDNDFGFLATIDPSSVSTLGLLQPKHGTVSINENGTILYIPNPGYSGLDTFDYRVCSTPSVVCDIARVIVKISTCPSNGNQNIISGQIFIDRNRNGLNDDGALGLAGIKVYLYTDGNCSGSPNANELTDSVTVDNSGFYQFVKYPEKTVEDDFEGTSGNSSCAAGSDGDSPWGGNWTDQNDVSNGFCNNSHPLLNTDVEIARDGAFGWGIRLKDNDVSASRTVNLNGAVKAFLTFAYRRKTALASGENVLVQVSANGTTFSTIYTIAGNGTSDAEYVTIYNQDISAFAATGTIIRFLTNSGMDDNDTVYIDNVTIKFLRYPQCYITSVDAASIPGSYTMTTVGQKAVSIVSGGSCTSQFDFGLAKTNVTISGRLLCDKNGLIDGQVNGYPHGAPSGGTVYAYLIDASGKVALKTTVNSGTGVYTFPLAEANSSYTLILSMSNVALGSAAPASGNFPALWAAVGDSYGLNNGAGTGVEAGTPDAAVAVQTSTVNVLNVDFGIQRLPDSDSYFSGINQPHPNQVVTLNGGVNPPVLSGSDPEDCVSGCVLTTRNVIIDQVPVNAELYYNNALVTNGQLIQNFDPSLFQIKLTPAAIGDTVVYFRYSYVDDAMMKDPTPATYSLVWMVPLGADALVAKATLNEHVTTVKWHTIAEVNTSHFVVERSTDNRDFVPVGSNVAAAGTYPGRKDYQLQDDVSSLAQSYNVVYYRVKLVDRNNKFKYSNTEAVRISSPKVEVSAWPNPFRSSITVNINADKATTFHFRLTDASGKTITQMKQAVGKGTSQVPIRELDRLPQGMYLLEVRDERSPVPQVIKLVKS